MNGGWRVYSPQDHSQSIQRDGDSYIEIGIGSGTIFVLMIASFLLFSFL